MNHGRVNQRRNLLLNNPIGLDSTDEGDPDGVFIDNINPLYEPSSQAVVIFSEPELCSVDLVQYILNGIGAYRVSGELLTLKLYLFVYCVCLIGELLELAGLYNRADDDEEQ